MRHRKKGRELSRTSTHRKALLRNLVTSLFRHERVETTTAKAKELRPYAERLITLARRGTFTLGDSQVVRFKTVKYWVSSLKTSLRDTRSGLEAIRGS